MVIGHIGRFCKQKNHEKIIEIFNSYQKENPNSVLLLVGEGETLTQVKKQVKELLVDLNKK